MKLRDAGGIFKIGVLNANLEKTLKCKESRWGAGRSWITIHSEYMRFIFHREIFDFSHFTLKSTVSCLNYYILRFGGIDIFCEQKSSKRSKLLITCR